MAKTAAPKTVAPKTTAKNLLANLMAKATPKAITKAKDERTTWIPESNLQSVVGELIELTTLGKEVEPLVDLRKNEVYEALFLLWTEKMWNTKSVPDNPRVLVKKRDLKGHFTDVDDMSLLFQVKFRSDGVAKLVPDVADLPPGKTAEDLLLSMLTGPAVGLTSENAVALLNPEIGDIQVRQKLELKKPLNDLMESEVLLEASAGNKLVTYFQSSPVGRKNTVELEPLTAEETAACLTTRQIVSLKAGFFERACSYCISLEQLRKLLKFTKPTLMVSSVQFAIGATPSERLQRLEDTVAHFLAPDNVK